MRELAVLREDVRVDQHVPDGPVPGPEARRVRLQHAAARQDLEDPLDDVLVDMEVRDVPVEVLIGAVPEEAELGLVRPEDLPLRVHQVDLRAQAPARPQAPPHPLEQGAVQVEEVADQLELWVKEEAADGFIIAGATPKTLDTFVEKVVPLLQQRGLYRTEYPGTTLRASFGLKRPENQFEQSEKEHLHAVE